MAIKYKLGKKVGKCKLRFRTGNINCRPGRVNKNLGPRACKCKLRARAGKYKLGSRARNRGCGPGTGIETKQRARKYKDRFD